jgi:hypothetical protein
MAYNRLIDAISSLQIVELIKTKVYVGRDDDSWSKYYRFFGFTSKFIKDKLECALKANCQSVISTEYWIEALIDSDRCIVDRTEEYYSIEVNEDIKVRLWLLDIIRSNDSFAQFSISSEVNGNDYLTAFSYLNVEFDIAISLRSVVSRYELECHYISKIEWNKLSSIAFKVSKGTFDKLEDGHCSVIHRYLQTLRVQSVLDEMKQVNDTLTIGHFQSRGQKYYSQRERLPKKVGKYAYGHKVYILENNGQIIGEAIVRAFNGNTKKYLVTYPFAVDRRWSDDLDEENLIGYHDYNTPMPSSNGLSDPLL